MSLLVTCQLFLTSSFLQLASGKAGILAAKVLVQCRSQLASDAEVTSLWTASSLEWSSLGVPSEELGEFLSTHVSLRHRLSVVRIYFFDLYVLVFYCLPKVDVSIFHHFISVTSPLSPFLPSLSLSLSLSLSHSESYLPSR